MFQRYLTFISALGWEYIERGERTRERADCATLFILNAYSTFKSQLSRCFSIKTHHFSQVLIFQQIYSVRKIHRNKQNRYEQKKNDEKSGKKCFNWQTVKWDIPMTKEIQIDLFGMLFAQKPKKSRAKTHDMTKNNENNDNRKMLFSKSYIRLYATNDKPPTFYRTKVVFFYLVLN